jgi:peptidoglycan-associated lipoprotein
MTAAKTVAAAKGSQCRPCRFGVVAVFMAITACQTPTESLPKAPIFEFGGPPPSPSEPLFSVQRRREVSRFAGATTIYFNYDSAEISVEAKSILERQAEWLRSQPQVTALLVGHADELGTREFKFALGQQRAVAMKFYLVAMGVDESRLSTTSFGKQRPVVGGIDNARRQQDRRGETILIGVPK